MHSNVVKCQIRCQTSLCVKQTQVSTLDSYKKGYSRSSGVTVFCLTLITQYKFRLWLAITRDLSSYVGLKHTRQYTTLHSNGCFLITPEYYIFTAVLILWVCKVPRCSGCFQSYDCSLKWRHTSCCLVVGWLRLLQSTCKDIERKDSDVARCRFSALRTRYQDRYQHRYQHPMHTTTVVCLDVIVVVVLVDTNIINNNTTSWITHTTLQLCLSRRGCGCCLYRICECLGYPFLCIQHTVHRITTWCTSIRLGYALNLNISLGAVNQNQLGFYCE